jgi:required for meiotic nuclear division protein 1
LRRVAVEAQRSKDGGLLAKSNTAGDQALAPRLVTAYAVAEQFDLAKVVKILRSKGYEPDPLGTGLYPQVVHVQVPVSSIHKSIYQRPPQATSAPKREEDKRVPPFDSGDARQATVEVGDIFIFPSGTLVTWALPEGFTSFFATRTLLPAAEQPHVNSLETEDLDYIEDPSREHSIIRGDTIVLGTRPTTASSIQSDESQAMDAVLTKIAFSSGFARSTKLAVLETSLSSYLTSTAQIPTLLSRGSRLPLSISRSFILRKTGQLLSLRAQLNLYSELTDSLPDLFWDSRHELGLEGYYDQVGRALDVGIRIKVLNEKMDYAQEIAAVLRERLSEKHGLFLEWTIIVLIAIEVGFEILRLWREGFWDEVLNSKKIKKHSVAN